jgi:hypothetical protein
VGSPTRRNTAAGDDDDDVEEAKRRSGMRERLTEPAAPSDVAASARPTAVPDYDVAALSTTGVSLRHKATIKNLSLDVTIPIPTGAAAPPDLDLRLAFLLLHADGETSIGQIAAAVERPPHDVLASFVELAAHGLVRLAAPR